MMTRRKLSERLVGGAVFPVWARREYGGYAAFRRQIERSQYWSGAQLEQQGRQRLVELLRYAGAHCGFYRERFRAAGLRTEGAIEALAWGSLPLLTKRDIQDHGAELESDVFPRLQRVRNHTGGSTGSPLQFYVDRQRFGTRMASTHRHNAWAGYRPGDWAAELWGSRLDAAATSGWWDRCRKFGLYRTLDLNTSSIGMEDWSRYLATLRHHRPRFMVAYARAAVAFAQYLRDRGIEDIRFQAVITSAEVLSPAHRRMIESVLGGRVFDRYGCREVSVIASECSEHAGLHVNAEALLVEIVPAAGLPAPWGKVVITDLLNYSMPLIRYEVGDVARWSEAPCVCGRGLPMLAEVQGRATEFLRLPDGRMVSGPALTLVVADLAGVRQAQFVQRTSGEVLVKVVPAAGYGEATRCELRARLGPYLRGTVPLRIEEVAAIPSQPSGKYLFVVREGPAEGGEDASHGTARSEIPCPC